MAKLLVASVLIILVSHGNSFFLPYNGGSTGGPSQEPSDEMDDLKYPKGSMIDSWFGGKNIQSDLDNLRYPTQPLITSYLSKAIGLFSQIQASFRNFDSESQLSPIIANKISFLRKSVQSTLGFGGQSTPNKKLDDDFDSDFDSVNDGDSVSSDKSDDVKFDSVNDSVSSDKSDDAKSDDETKSDDENSPSNDDDLPSNDSNNDDLPSITSTDDKNVFFADLEEKNETPLTSSAIESESDGGSTTTSTTTESTNTSTTEDTDFDTDFDAELNADILETTSAADQDSKPRDKEDSSNEV